MRFPDKRYWPILGLLCTGSVILFLLGRTTPPPDDRYTASLITAHTRNRIVLLAREDSLKREASKARIVYVAARRPATEALDALPPAVVVGVSVTIPAGTFTVPPPIADWIADAEKVRATMRDVIAAADTALAKTVAVIPIADSVNTESTAIAEAEHARAEEHRPGFLARAWNRVRVPLAFVGGASLGYVVARVVP